MRHQNVNRKFGRETDQRRALLKSLVSNLVTHGNIITTEPKAKELRPLIEKLVTKAKVDSIATKRLLNERLDSLKIVNKLVKEISPKYMDRKGGYTRIIKMGPRGGDGSRMAIIEFV